MASQKKNIVNSERKISASRPEDPKIISKRKSDILEKQRSSLPPMKQNNKPDTLSCRQKAKKFCRTHWQGLAIVFMITISSAGLLSFLIRNKLGLINASANIELRVWSIFIVLFCWFTDVIPPAIAGLIPIVLLPILELKSAEEVALEYLTETNVLMISAFIISAVIETSSIHKIIAAWILLIVGFRVKTVHAIMMASLFIIGTLGEDTFTALFFACISKALLIIMDEEGICTMYEKTEDDM